MVSEGKIKTLIICFLTIILFTNIYSQDSLTVTGKVIDQSNNPVEGAEIITESNNSALTDSNGEYTVKVAKNNVPVDNTDIKPSNYESYRVKIFNILGQKIYESKITNNSANRYTWNGYNNSGEMVSSGIYFPILMINNKVVCKSKLTVLGKEVSNIRPFINYKNHNKSSGSLSKSTSTNTQYTIYFDIRGDNFTNFTDHPITISDQNNDDVYTAEDIQVNLYSENEMLFIEGGTFTMGDVWGDGTNREKPTHEVTVSSFYMSKYEVTHADYIEFLNSISVSSDGSYNGNELIDMDDDDRAIAHDGSSFYFFDGSGNADNDECPVIEVTWYGAAEYCNWMSEQEGLTKAYTISSGSVECDWNANGYRLPTEAEWEYAARSGGRDDRKWSGTNNKSDLGDYAWYSGSETHPVGTKQPNELGIYDMSGNVWEWCWDWYDNDYYTDSPSNNPKGPSSGSDRVLRGGSWNNFANFCRTANRIYYHPSHSYSSTGFRLLRTQ